MESENLVPKDPALISGGGKITYKEACKMFSKYVKRKDRLTGDEYNNKKEPFALKIDKAVMTDLNRPETDHVIAMFGLEKQDGYHNLTIILIAVDKDGVALTDDDKHENKFHVCYENFGSCCFGPGCFEKIFGNPCDDALAEEGDDHH